MTRLSRTSWSAALVVAIAGLLLSLVVILRASDGPAPVAEIRGPAAVGVQEGSPDQRVSQPGRREGGREPDARPFPEARTSDADLPRTAQVVAPRRLQLDALDLDLAVRAVGVGRRAQMQLPADPSVLGWYRFGPAPGAGSGSTVIAGHVDSRRYGVGPLVALSGARPGQALTVRLADGRRVEYRVDSVQRFDRQQLPDEVFSRSGPERLRLVTCTGPWLPEAGGYQQNLVVTAVPSR